jgi:predicted PurR-regulated permease PerM
VTESSNRPSDDNTAGDGNATAEAIPTSLSRPSFIRVTLVLAATVVVLAGIRLGAPVLNPIFFAIVLTLLVSPIYSWLLRRGLLAPLALVLMLVILATLFVGLSFILGASIVRFPSALATTQRSSTGN